MGETDNFSGTSDEAIAVVQAINERNRLLEQHDIEIDALKSTMAVSWGYLWHVATDDPRVHTARSLLGDALTNELRVYGRYTAENEGANHGQGKSK
jgi:hypothetical protein